MFKTDEPMRKQVKQTMKQNYKGILFLMVALLATLIFSSCKSTPDMTYAGDVIRFGKDVETSWKTQCNTRGWFMNCLPQSKPYNLERGSTEQWDMYNKIDENLQGDPNNTSTYYAMELAAKRIKYVRKKIFHNDPYTKYYVFLFTDGLENASPEIAKRDGRTFFKISPEKYQKRLHRKLKRAIGCRKNLFKVYPFVYTGQDLEKTFRDHPDETERVCELIHENLDSVRYCHKNYKKRPQLLLAAPEYLHLPSCVCDDNDAEKECDYSSEFAHSYVDMVQGIRDELDRSSIVIRVARGYAGKKNDQRGNIFMEFFDTINHRCVTLEFKFNKKCGSYTIKNETFKGYDAKASAIRYSHSDDANEFFIIDDLRIKTPQGLSVAFHPDSVTQYYIDPKTRLKQWNSEYESTPQEYLNAYYIIVIDHSNSMKREDNDESKKPEMGNISSEAIKGGLEDEKVAAQNIMLIMGQDDMDEKMKQIIKGKTERYAK